ncbi:MAG TPA: PQQ-binding-like beta-propeller repeat protein [Solirubrobacteraceae bacterium]|nr:PQQ-binding-like beta-propeller repeat protein [Solirubrobacteraceae bacterium]
MRALTLTLAAALALTTTACASSSGVSGPAPRATTATAPAPGAAAAKPRAKAADSVDWPTYHRDPLRTGFDQSVPQTTGAGEEWRSQDLDGKIYASPVVAGNTVIVATEGNSVYALDPTTGKVSWRQQLGAPVSGGSLPCGNIDPSGITSTPVIDPAGGTVYAVAFVAPARHVLFALDLTNGSVRFQRAVDAPGSDPRVQQQRGALALSQGRVYVPFGGLYGDCGAYHGYVVAAPADGGGGRLLSYRVRSAREAGIWAPSGPAVDGQGNIFVTTGNGSSTTRFDYGNSVLRLSPTLKLRDYFVPSNTTSLNRSDTDLGSVGPALLPNDRVFQIGKEGVGYLLNARRLGKRHPLASRHICSAAFGGTASDGANVYVPCVDGIVAVRTGSHRLSVAWKGPGFRAGPPIVAGGAVWTLDLDGGVLYALSAADGSVIAKTSVGSVAQFTTPAESAGRVLVAAGTRVVAVTIRH